MFCVCVNVYVHVFLSVCVSLATHGHLHQFISKKAFYWKHAPPPHMFVLKSTLLPWLPSSLCLPSLLQPLSQLWKDLHEIAMAMTTYCPLIQRLAYLQETVKDLEHDISLHNQYFHTSGKLGCEGLTCVSTPVCISTSRGCRRGATKLIWGTFCLLWCHEVSQIWVTRHGPGRPFCNTL